MNNTLKTLLKWAITFVLCFIVIYSIVFFGGWKLLESGDPVLMELGVALVLSIFVFVFIEVITHLAKRITSLEERLNQLEDK